ncbi:MAG: hypothetical protein ACK41E_02680 [Deinococcales bacterium]
MKHSEALNTHLVAWNERDSDKRIELLQGIAHPDVPLFDPRNHQRGIKAIADFIGGIQQKIAFARLEYTTKIQKHDFGE